MRGCLKLPAGSIAIGGIILSSPSAAGSRKHQVDQNDGDILTCSDDGKVTFYLGCGRLAESAGGEARFGPCPPHPPPSKKFFPKKRDCRGGIKKKPYPLFPPQ